MLGSIQVSAHFARKAGQSHDAARGCEFGNTSISKAERGERVNRLQEFIRARGHRYLYLNGNAIKDQISLQSKWCAEFRRVGHHLTAKQGNQDATYGVKSAKDLARLNRYQSFDDKSFYKNVTIVASGFLIPFNNFFFPDPATLLNHVVDLKKHSSMHPIVTEVTPLLSKAIHQRNEHGYRGFIPCRPTRFVGPRSGFEYLAQPVLNITHPDIVEKLKDDTPYIVCAAQSFARAAKMKDLMREIRAGNAENRLPVYLQIKDADAICPVAPSKE
jgi:hypothetical protein